MGYTLKIADYSTNSKATSCVIMKLMEDIEISQNVRYHMNKNGTMDTYRFKMPISDFAKMVYHLKEISNENDIWGEMTNRLFSEYANIQDCMTEDEIAKEKKWFLDMVKRLYDVTLNILLEAVWEKKKNIKFRWE